MGGKVGEHKHKSVLAQQVNAQKRRAVRDAKRDKKPKDDDY